MPGLRIAWTNAAGEEREEAWPNVERFRLWAAAEGLRVTFSAYQEDEDGEWILVERGRVGGR